MINEFKAMHFFLIYINNKMGKNTGQPVPIQMTRFLIRTRFTDPTRIPTTRPVSYRFGFSSFPKPISASVRD